MRAIPPWHESCSNNRTKPKRKTKGRKRKMNKLMLAGGIALTGLALCGATNETAQVAARAAAASTNGVAAASAPAVDEEAAKRAADRALIEGLLKQAGLKYAVEENGDFLLVFDMDDSSRSQRMWVEAEIQRYEECRMLHLVSVAYQGVLTKPMALDLLSDHYKVGFWDISKRDSDCAVVRFVAQVPPDIGLKEFRAFCFFVATAADRLERKWSDSDSL